MSQWHIGTLARFPTQRPDRDSAVHCRETYGERAMFMFRTRTCRVLSCLTLLAVSMRGTNHLNYTLLESLLHSSLSIPCRDIV